MQTPSRRQWFQVSLAELGIWVALTAVVVSFVKWRLSYRAGQEDPLPILVLTFACTIGCAFVVMVLFPSKTKSRLFGAIFAVLISILLGLVTLIIRSGRNF